MCKSLFAHVHLRFTQICVVREQINFKYEAHKMLDITSGWEQTGLKRIWFLAPCCVYFHNAIGGTEVSLGSNSLSIKLPKLNSRLVSLRTSLVKLWC